MQKNKFILLIIICLFDFSTSFSQLQNTIILDSIVGEFIDPPEKEKYDLFSSVPNEDFQSAFFFRNNDSLLIVRITLKDKSTFDFPYSEKQLIQDKINITQFKGKPKRKKITLDLLKNSNYFEDNPITCFYLRLCPSKEGYSIDMSAILENRGVLRLAYIYHNSESGYFNGIPTFQQEQKEVIYRGVAVIFGKDLTKKDNFDIVPNLGLHISKYEMSKQNMYSFWSNNEHEKGNLLGLQMAIDFHLNFTKYFGLGLSLFHNINKISNFQGPLLTCYLAN